MTHAQCKQAGEGSRAPEDESIDLSAGFVPKNTPVASEPPLDELTPDSFMAQQAKPAAAPAELTFDSFMAQQAPVATDESSEAEPGDTKPAEIIWYWATEHDLPALQLIHFNAEISAGRELHLPELSFNGKIAVARRKGEIIGGVFCEESTTISLIVKLDAAKLSEIHPGQSVQPEMTSRRLSTYD
jgi:hypothetical protein